MSDAALRCEWSDHDGSVGCGSWTARSRTRPLRASSSAAAYHPLLSALHFRSATASVLTEHARAVAQVECSNHTRYAGLNGMSNGCNSDGVDGCPASAPPTWLTVSGCLTGRVCAEPRDCTPVRCRPYIPPANGRVLWPVGESELSSWEVFDTLTVQCNAGFMPESQVGMVRSIL